LFSCYLHFSLNVCCNHSMYSHHNCYQQTNFKQKGPCCEVWPYRQ